MTETAQTAATAETVVSPSAKYTHMIEHLIQPIENTAASILNGVAELFGKPGDPLSGPPRDGAVKLPDDLFAQPDVQTEWWYYTGHCTTRTGRQFGFELVFFKRRTDRDKIGVSSDERRRKSDVFCALCDIGRHRLPIQIRTRPELRKSA
jgi:predicted secreted hydrolase